jgi:ketosteroid isomerase-like protein
MVDARIAALAAEREIHAMLIDYMEATDDATVDSLPTAEFFTEDAVLDTPGGRDEGLRSIMDGQVARLKAGKRAAQHVMTGVRMTVDLEKGVAQVRSNLLFLVRDGDSIKVGMAGRYRDVVVRDAAGRWKIRGRVARAVV